ncbi:peptide transporter PTR2B [Mycena leptocephala]|nr:peptide transporter PTR2B [Mycena leptocephala]
MLQYIVFLHLLNTYFPHMPVTMAKNGADEETIDSANPECVTEHELATLRHVRDKMPWQAFSVGAIEFAERWTYRGTSNIYNNYIRAPLPLGSRNGAVLPQNRSIGFNSFFVYLTPLLGGIIADTKWGRYNTIFVFTVVIILGHIILIASAAPASLEHPQMALGLLVLAILVMALGAGSIKANVPPMVAEQYQGKLRKRILPSGETVIISPSLTLESIYLYFYLVLNLGSAGAISASFLARDNGYWAAFLVPTCIFITVPVLLYLSRNSYVKTPPRGAILIETFRVLRICLKLRELKTSDFWDAAKPSTYSGREIPVYITWDDEFVSYSQIDGNFGTIAAGMTLNGAPNDVVQNLNPLSIIVMIPVFEQVIYPFLRRRGINFSPIKRITAGYFVIGLAMFYAAVLEKYLYSTSPCPNHQPAACIDNDGSSLVSPISVWVVSAPYILVGAAEVFAVTASLEYAYAQAPRNMKSVVSAFSQLQTSFAAVLNFALIDVNVEDRFQWLFVSFGIVATIFAALFYWTFRDLEEKVAPNLSARIGPQCDHHGYSSSCSPVAEGELADLAEKDGSEGGPRQSVLAISIGIQEPLVLRQNDG